MVQKTIPGAPEGEITQKTAEPIDVGQRSARDTNKHRAIIKGESHFCASKETKDLRIPLEGIDLELAMENKRRREIAVKARVDGYYPRTARGGSRAKAERLCLKDFGLSRGQQSALTKLEEAVAKNPTLFDDELSATELANAADELRQRTDKNAETQAIWRTENAASESFRREIEIGNYVLEKESRHIGTDGGPSQKVVRFYSSKLKRHIVVHCDKFTVPVVDDRGHRRMRKFESKKKAEAFFELMTKGELSHCAFYSPESYELEVQHFLAFSEKKLAPIKSEVAKENLDEKGYNDAVRSIQWPELPHNLSFVIALAKSMLAKRVEGSFNKNPGDAADTPGASQGAGRWKKSGIKKGYEAEWNTDRAEWGKLTKEILGNIEIPIAGDKNFKDSNRMIKWVHEHLIIPVVNFGAIKGRSKGDKASEATFGDRFHALVRAFRIVEELEPFRRRFKLKDPELTDGIISISEIIENDWYELAEKAIDDDINTHKPLTMDEVVAFSSFLSGKKDIGQLNTFFLGLTTGLRPGELSKLVKSFNDGQPSLFYNHSSLTLKYRDLITKTKVKTTPLVSLLAHVILAGPRETMTLGDFSYRDFSTVHRKSYRTLSGKIGDKKISFAAIYPRRIRATCSMNLIFCEGDRDPRSAIAGRFLASERLGHSENSSTLMKHYCTNKPSISVAPLSLFRILKESDRKILEGHAILDGSNAWDAFLFKTWFGLISDKLDQAQQKQLNAFIIQAKGALLQHTGWEPGYSEKYALANRVTDIFAVAVRMNAEAIHNHLRTHQVQDDFLKRLKMQIDPKNVEAIELIDAQIADAKKSAEATGINASETKTMQVEWKNILAKLDNAEQAVEHLPGDHVTMINRYSQKFLSEGSKADKDDKSGEQNKNEDQGRKVS